ncbi:MAG: amidohydrolase family protein [Planctomycetes bacterium]|nr:amidohydrolase family protein [Planctomycetota bacterium]
MHRSDTIDYTLRPRHLRRLRLVVAGLIACFVLCETSALAADAVTAIRGGDLYTITSGTIRNGTVLIKDGRIWKIGRGLSVPKDAKVIEARGKIVMPGLVAVRGNLGVGSGARIADGLDPFHQSVSFALASGVTSVYVSRGSADAVIKPTYGDLDSMIVKTSVLQPLSISNRQWLSKTSLLMALRKTRTYLQDLARHNRDKAAGKQTPPPAMPGEARRYVALLKGEATALIQADAARDILGALELVDEFGIKMIINGGVEAWTVAQEIAKRKVAVTMIPRAKRQSDDELSVPSGSNLENAAILKQAGVRFAIIPPSTSFTSSTGGIAGRDLMTLPLEAAFAVGGGLDEQTALEAITIVPAQLLGVDDRVGSLQPGKDADIIILDGHPFHYNTFVQTTIVNGQVLYEKQKSTYFSHVQH